MKKQQRKAQKKLPTQSENPLDILPSLIQQSLPAPRSLRRFSRPIPGKPFVWWTPGSKPHIVVEVYPPGRGKKKGTKKGKKTVYDFSPPEKYIIYDRRKPEAQLVWIVRPGKKRGRPRRADLDRELTEMTDLMAKGLTWKEAGETLHLTPKKVHQLRTLKAQRAKRKRT